MMKKWAYKILLSPYFLSLFIAVIIIFSLPPVFERFKIGYEGNEIQYHKNPESFLCFRDINDDGRGEKIDSYYSSEGHASVQIYKADGGICDQWNFRGRFPVDRRDAVVFCDIFHDETEEIIVFTAIRDSVFFSCIEKLDGSFRFKERLLARISTEYSPVLSYRIRPEGFFDLNRDGFPELLVTVAGARSLQPRRVLAFDFVNDSLWTSGSYGSCITSIKAFDVDRDGFPELTGNTGAGGNVHDSLGIPFSDYSAWFMVLDHNLELRFNPVEFPGFRNDLMVLPCTGVDSTRLVACLNPVGTALDYPVLMTFSPEGKVIREKILVGYPKMTRSLSYNPYDPSRLTFLLSEMNRFTVFDEDLDIRYERELAENHSHTPESYDLEDDGASEMIIPDEFGRKLFIYSSLEATPTEYDISFISGWADVSFGRSAGGKPVIILQGEGKYQMLLYLFNPLFYLRWLIYAGIYAGVLIFILLIRRLQRIQMERKQAIRDQIRQLQIKTIHNQLDPHFTFNVFNSIAHIIRTEEKDSAYRSFLRFTGIVRSTLMSSDKIVRTLEEEIQFVENYLELEKLRYKERLHFEIHTGPDIDLKVMLPKMIVQIFVENAVKHGIRHKPEGGKVAVTIKPQDKKLLIIVEDDGIGRKRAGQFAGESTGMGLQIMDRYIELFNQLNRQKIVYTIEDLMGEDGEGAGTRVVIDLAI